MQGHATSSRACSWCQLENNDLKKSREISCKAELEQPTYSQVEAGPCPAGESQTEGWGAQWCILPWKDERPAGASGVRVPLKAWPSFHNHSHCKLPFSIWEVSTATANSAVTHKEQWLYPECIMADHSILPKGPDVIKLWLQTLEYKVKLQILNVLLGN